MNSNTSVIIGYITSAVLVAVGILLMTGVLLGAAEKSTRIVFGGCLTAWGIYRAITVFSKVKAAQMEEKREQMKKQTEKLLNKK